MFLTAADSNRVVVIVMFLTAADSNRGSCCSRWVGTPPHHAVGPCNLESGGQVGAWGRSDCHWICWAPGSSVVGRRLQGTSLATLTFGSEPGGPAGSPPARERRGGGGRH